MDSLTENAGRALEFFGLSFVCLFWFFCFCFVFHPDSSILGKDDFLGIERFSVLARNKMQHALKILP